MNYRLYDAHETFFVHIFFSYAILQFYISCCPSDEKGGNYKYYNCNLTSLKLIIVENI